MKHIWIALLALGCATSQTSTPEPAPAAVVPEPPPPPKPVDPIPEGFHGVTPALTVADIPAAITWYTTALGAEHRFTMDGPDGKPMHAEIKIGDSIIFLSPENADRNEKGPLALKGTNGSLHVYVADVDAAVKKATDAGAKVTMPVEDMWWGDRFGEVTDPSGHRWSIATHIEDVPPEVMKTRSEGAMAAMAKKKKYTFEKGPAAANFKPEGWFTVTPSLVVKGGQDAVDFYKNALGAEVITSTLMPDGSLMHAEVKLGDSQLMLSGEMPSMASSKAPATLGGATMSIMLYVPDTDATFAKATGAGATKVLEAEDMFWGDRFAVVTDPSGNPVSIATHVEDVSPDEMKQRMMQDMAPPPGEAAPAEGAAPAAEGAAPAEATPPPK